MRQQLRGQQATDPALGIRDGRIADDPIVHPHPHPLKGRQGGHHRSHLQIAVAVNTEGVREVLGMAIGPSEAEPFWTGFLRSPVTTSEVPFSTPQ
jgi:hypothetical protein